MKIGILGTRGIPNRYGGFERFAEYLSAGLAMRGHAVSVYCPSHQEYTASHWKGVELIRCYDPEPVIGTAGQFLYDFNCIRDSHKREFDILLLLGYTSSSVWGKWLPKEPLIISNMDGLEWKRSKYNQWVRQFLKKAERWAVRQSDLLIADAPAIQQYYKQAYGVEAHYIPYAANVLENADPATLQDFQLEPFQYDLLIARMEPENNIETVIKGKLKSDDDIPLLLFGDPQNKFGQSLKARYASEKIVFMGSLYDQNALDNLRHFCRLYFHGHSVGGTNPSLLEAMGAGALIAAHDNVYNSYVLDSNGLFWKNEQDITSICKDLDREKYTHFLIENRRRIQKEYSVENIVHAYEHLFTKHI